MTANLERISENAIFRVGKVFAVRGRTVEVKVDKTKNTSHILYKGDLVKGISVGGYVRIAKGFTAIIGKVEGEEITEDLLRGQRRDYGSDREKVNRILTISLLGFFKDGQFERGIKELPLIDNECFLLHKHEFEQIHDFIRKDDVPLHVGYLALEKGQPIRLGVSALFASHIGIFGNTGSGKSYTLAKLYRELFGLYKDNTKFRDRARFFFIDFNGEYMEDSDVKPDNVMIEEQYKNIYRLSTLKQAGKQNESDKYPMPRETITDPDFWVTFLEATEKTQTPFLRRAIDNDYIESRIEDETLFKELIANVIALSTAEGDRQLDKNITIQFLTELNAALRKNSTLGMLLNDYRTSLQYNSHKKHHYYKSPELGTVYPNQPEFRARVIDEKIHSLVSIRTEKLSAISKIQLRIVIQYYDEIIKGFSNKEFLAPLIKRMDRRIDDLEKVIRVIDQPASTAPQRNITIISLRDVNIQIKKVLPLLLGKTLYNGKKSSNRADTYLNIIIDEAHNILSHNSQRESEQWKDYRLETFEEIIKEGRKFGVFLTIASQRPSDISPTIISQLHNYFLHRLINNEDISAVRQTVSYLDKVSFDSLPILPTGTCILAGLLANIPVVLDIGKIEPPSHEPKNKTLTLTDKWDA